MSMKELIIRVLCDVKPASIVDGAVLYAQTADNQNSVLYAAKEIIDNNLARKVMFVKCGPISGYPGFSIWEKELKKRGTARSNIVGINTGKIDLLNTLVESEAIIKYAAQEELGSLYVVSSPFHQLRAFMTLVSVAVRHFPELNIFSYNGYTMPWLDKVTHSQGVTLGTRKEIIKKEFERIELYKRKGDLSPEAEILEYLNKRDGLKR